MVVNGLKLNPSLKEVGSKITCTNPEFKPDMDESRSKSTSQTRNFIRETKRPRPRDSPEKSNHQIILEQQSFAANLEKRSCEVVKCLRQFGMAVIDNFLGENTSRLIRQEAENLSGKMVDGMTLKKSRLNSDAKRYRQDKIVWVEGKEPGTRHIGLHLHSLDTLIAKVNSELIEYDIHGRSLGMVACYPGKGTGYIRHVDNPHKDGRVLTCIYYLNESWTPQDGGSLRLYPSGAAKVATVNPILDRLLIFWSDSRTPHEVLPSYTSRYAVTLWYFDKKERQEATKRLELREKNRKRQSKEISTENYSRKLQRRRR